MRYNITFSSSVASCFAKNSGYQHIEAVNTILQYLKGLNKQQMIYGGQNKLLVEAYSNFDWLKDKKSWKLTFSLIFMLKSHSVSWYLKKQPTVTFS